jgi:hypothetical protein
MEAAVAASGLAPAGDGTWVDARGQAGVVCTAAGAFVGWLDVEAGPEGLRRRLRDVEHVVTPDDLCAALGRARARRAALLEPCALCDLGLLPGHLH